MWIVQSLRMYKDAWKHVKELQYHVQTQFTQCIQKIHSDNNNKKKWVSLLTKKYSRRYYLLTWNIEVSWLVSLW